MNHSKNALKRHAHTLSGDATDLPRGAASQKIARRNDDTVAPTRPLKSDTVPEKPGGGEGEGQGTFKLSGNPPPPPKFKSETREARRSAWRPQPWFQPLQSFCDQIHICHLTKFCDRRRSTVCSTFRLGASFFRCMPPSKPAGFPNYAHPHFTKSPAFVRQIDPHGRAGGGRYTKVKQARHRAWVNVGEVSGMGKFQ